MTETLAGSLRAGGRRSATRPRSGRDRRNIALWTLQILLAAFFLLVGLSKLIFHIEIFDDIGWGAWFQYLAGSVQIVGAIGLVVPRLSGLAALAFVGFVLWALGFHLTVLTFTPLPIITLGVVAAIIAWGRRDTTLRLIGKRA